MKTYVSILFTLAVIALISCRDEKSAYDFKRYFTQQQRDTLMVDMVTLIGKKPKTADYQTRLEPRFREYYTNLAAAFAMKHFHIEDDTCYFFMIRPARSVRGNNRGVGGKFTMNQDMKIEYFEETFNTPIHQPEELERIGWRLFRELITHKSIEGLRWNFDYIEWPDDRLKYDLEKREWRYDVDNTPYEGD
jgi:hypothetical protein